MDHATLRNTIYQTILELATDDGINASGKEEIYGCIFGRDSFITILKLLKIIENPQAQKNFDVAPLEKMCKRALETLVSLQGRTTNIESGEEPGKFIHEYRKEKYEHLVNRSDRPWFLYPDKIMRIYDSIDSTPLGLIALHKYWKVTGDDAFLLKVLPAIEEGLNWIITYGDRDKDFLLEYELPKTRIHGGLVVQSWTDSIESLTQADGTFPEYPIAQVEVQGYAWLALQLWADFYRDSKQHYAKTKNFAQKLRTQASQMKKRFNELFLFENENFMFPVQALNGYKQQIKTVTGNSLLLLWATYHKNGKNEVILEDELIPDLVKRSFLPDLFEPDAGIRTMSTKALTYNPGIDSYHNGSFWPKLNGMAHEGLIQWCFEKEAQALKFATLKPIEFFGSPIELYIKTVEGQYHLFQNSSGQQSCKQQAWSAAAALDLLTL
ncbi:MAG TPA: amylo-alpha-1,6-glucosidase [Candidatus Saccharimonadales bacterium]|nr:amylo-alpha-1,6-glucosidase [Candidatus Saccharimonadales bacterium]